MGWGFEADTLGRCFIALCDLTKFAWSCGLYRDGANRLSPPLQVGRKSFKNMAYGSNSRIDSRTQVHIQEGGAELDNDLKPRTVEHWRAEHVQALLSGPGSLLYKFYLSHV